MAAGSANSSPVPSRERVRRGRMEVTFPDAFNAIDERCPTKGGKRECRDQEEVSDVSGFLVAASLEESSYSIVF